MIGILFYNIISDKVSELINDILINAPKEVFKFYCNVKINNTYNYNIEVVNITNLEEFIRVNGIHMLITNSLNEITKNMLNNSNYPILTLRKHNTDKVKHIRELKDVLTIICEINNKSTQEEVIEENVNESICENIDDSISKVNNISGNIEIVNTNVNVISILLLDINVMKIKSIINDILSYRNDVKFKIYVTVEIENNYICDIEVINLNKLNTLENVIINKQIDIVIVNKITNITYKLIHDNKCIFMTLHNQNISNIINISHLKNILVNFTNFKVISIVTDKKISLINKNELIRVTKNLPEKESFRTICVSYLETIRKIKIPSLKLNLEKETVLIEFRILEHLECLVRNVIINVGNEWSHTIICGNLNYEYISNFCKNISKNIKIIKLNYDNLTHNQYNNFMLTQEVWNNLVGEKILLYQEDTCIFKKNINDFITYDYIGAPFGPSCVTPINTGNGGFSLRSKSIMKKTLEICNPANFNTNAGMVNWYKNRCNLDMFPEDIYYPQVIQDNSLGLVAPKDIAIQFSNEHIYKPGSLGMHCLWFCCKKWKQVIIDYFEELCCKDLSSKLIKENPIQLQKKKNNFDVYIIHPKEYTDREESIEKNIKKLKEQFVDDDIVIKIFNSVDTSKCELDINSQKNILKKYDKNLDFDNKWIFNKSGQIGCYLGHHLAVKEIMENNKEGYSIIFEDDFVFGDIFYNSINNIINYFNSMKESFDIIFLGSLCNNKGTKKHDNIYNINKKEWLFGAQGLLIKNSSAEKLYNYNCKILHEIDNHYKILMNKDLITGYYIYPSLVRQQKTKIKSRIAV
jgi:GR25 family glycosyltransferase involved in LPS biosynthesis